MANVKLFDQTGKEVSTVELNDAIFGIEPNESVVFDVVISQRASLRQGTHAVKTVQQYQVADVNHGVKRNWTCSSRFYPLTTMAWWWCCLRTNSTFLRIQTSTKVRRLALKSVYSAKVAEDKFVAVEALSFAPKLLNSQTFFQLLASILKYLLSLRKETNSLNFQHVTLQT